MRKLILRMELTLDGVAAGENGPLDMVDYGDEGSWNDIFATLETVDAMLIGGGTYREYLGYWQATLTNPSAGCKGAVRAQCKAKADASLKCEGKCEGEVTPPSAKVECQAAARDAPQHDDAGQQAQPAAAGHHQRHARAALRIGAVVPVADEQERGEAGEFPEHHQLQQVARQAAGDISGAERHRAREQRDHDAELVGQASHEHAAKAEL